MSSRRKFLKKSIIIPSIMILPRHVLGGKGYTSPSDKLNIAGVGVRKWGMGSGNLSSCETENIVALCDVDHKLSAETFNKYPKAKVYKDFRVMLETQKDIDAVIVATPDHTHAIISMMSIKLGKHVFCQMLYWTFTCMWKHTISVKCVCQLQRTHLCADIFN